MDSDPVIFLKLYGPAVCGITAAVALFIYRGKGAGTSAVLKPFGSFLDIKIPLSYPLLIRGLLVAVLLVFALMYLFIDYSSLFPSQLKMEVFYDDQGLEQAINDLGPGAREQLRIPPNYSDQRDEYFATLDDEVRKLISSSPFFRAQGGSVFSVGSTTFVVKKIGGIQHYHISEATGELSHTLNLPNHAPVEFRTLFQKQDTSADFIDVSVSDLIIRRSVLLQPIFRQLIMPSASSASVQFKVAILGVTKVTIFPWPSYTSTIYLADFPKAGRIPIGYAKYQ